MINYDLKIQSCKIVDLSQELKNIFVNQLKEDEIETLTLFYDPASDLIILNSDNIYQDTYKLLTITYLSANEEIRGHIKEQAGDLFSGILGVLDDIIKCREKKKQN